MVHQCLVGLAGAVIIALGLTPIAVQTQGAAGLTGTVTSPQEGKMEGVVVTARGDGANFSVSVVSDAQGRYSFPRTHLPAGKYSLKIRAFGYDLAGADTVEVPAGKTATLDLQLAAAKDPSTQLTSADWLNVLPGTDQQKAMVQKVAVSCTYCHSVERIVKSRHSAEQFVNVIHRMHEYFGDGSMASTEGRGRAVLLDKAARDAVRKNPVWGYYPPTDKTELAAYLATINQHGGRQLPQATKALPRPKGKETRVIVTTWDMPRKDTVPHDSDVDSKGNVWYTDQSDYFVGRLEPKTGTFKEWPLPKSSHHGFGGGSDVQVDRRDRVWFTAIHDDIPNHFGMLGVFDPRTEQYEFVNLGERSYSQFNALAADGSLVQGTLKIDPEAKKILEKFEWQKSPNAPKGLHVGYEPTMDSRGNWYITDFAGAYIVEVDAKTKEAKFHKVPTDNSMPRRGRIDAQDRFWFGEYFGDRIAMFDTKNKTFKEWAVARWGAPYTASVPNRNGHVFSPSNSSDRVYRLDPKTGEVLAYLMPTMNFDSKQVSIDPVGGKAALLANTRNAQIIRIEPLD
jgi:virginiamycin B lyase